MGLLYLLQQVVHKKGTKNVRTLRQGGKFANLKKEIQKNELPILRVNEAWWKGQGEIQSCEYTVYYFGGKRAESGIAIVGIKVW
jgi:hypothetical protein